MMNNAAIKGGVSISFRCQFPFLCIYTQKWDCWIMWELYFCCCCCCCSVAQSCLTLCNAIECSTPGFPVLHRLLELAQTHIQWVSDATQPFVLCLPLLLLPSIFPRIRVFSTESVLHIRWPRYWSCSLIISPSNEYSGLIFPSIDWLDLLAVQGTLKSLLQYHSSKASILQCSAFFMVQLSHPYMDHWRSHSFDDMDLC